VDAEFNWWLLIVGLVVGAGLVWLVVLDSRRRESDVTTDEMAREALWLSAALEDEGMDISPATAGRLLELHRAYLASPPPDEPHAVDPEPGRPTEPFDWPVEPHDRPMSTGSASVEGTPTSTSETPNVAGESSPASAADAPTQ
jgi:hypothetical protein